MCGVNKKTQIKSYIRVIQVLDSVITEKLAAFCASLVALHSMPA